MKGKIEKHKDWYIRNYKVIYIAHPLTDERSIYIRPEDMPEFMDDIFSSWMKLDKENIYKIDKKEYEEKMKEYFKSRKVVFIPNKKVITKQEEAEQNRDEQEMEEEYYIQGRKTKTESHDFDDSIDKESRAYKRGFEKGYKIAKEIYTKQGETEQDRDEQERLSEYFKTETYNNPFPTDEALEFDVNIRERV